MAGLWHANALDVLTISLSHTMASGVLMRAENRKDSTPQHLYTSP